MTPEQLQQEILAEKAKLTELKDESQQLEAEIQELRNKMVGLQSRLTELNGVGGRWGAIANTQRHIYSLEKQLKVSRCSRLVPSIDTPKWYVDHIKKIYRVTRVTSKRIYYTESDGRIETYINRNSKDLVGYRAYIDFDATVEAYNRNGKVKVKID